MKFKDKIVLITGGTRGIGAATARKYSDEGASVIITYKSNKENAEAFINELNESSILIKASLDNKDEIENIFTIVRQKYGRLDILVNNVGISKSEEFLKKSVEDWDRIIYTNLTSMFLTCQLAIPLIKSGGNIVNISSMRGLSDHGRPPIIDYSVSKAGVISFTKTLAKELAPQIRVNCVSPGVTNTEITKTFSKELLHSFIESIYLKRLLEPVEIANAIIFLTSDAASGITGVNLLVDGGQSLGK